MKLTPTSDDSSIYWPVLTDRHMATSPWVIDNLAYHEDFETVTNMCSNVHIH